MYSTIHLPDLENTNNAGRWTDGWRHIFWRGFWLWIYTLTSPSLPLSCERCSEEEGKVISSVHSIIKTEASTWGSHTVRPQWKNQGVRVLPSVRWLPHNEDPIGNRDLFFWPVIAIRRRSHSPSWGRSPATSAWFPPGNVLAWCIVWCKCLLCCATLSWMIVWFDFLWCLLWYLRSCIVISERLSAGTILLGFLHCVR